MNRIAAAVSALFLLLFQPTLKADLEGNEKAVQPVFVPGRISQDDLLIQAPEHLEKNKPQTFRVSFVNLSHRRLHEGKGSLTFIVNGIPQEVLFTEGKAELTHTFTESFISIYCDDYRYQQQIGTTAAWIFFLPALLIPVIAVVAKRRRQKKGGIKAA
jgi:hypothetical protein